ncbi:MAG: hypothetical protein IJF11_01400 [Clostridia bacterium]|nr:hypothetical protein [Clostridia bacterium]
MKSKFRLLFVMAFALMLIMALTLVCSATEYTVSSADEFNSAFSSALDGDTIVINADIKTYFDFGKSITYILDGGVKWTVDGGYVNGLDMNTAEGKTVSIMARNGDGIFYPNAGMWCNDGKYTCTFANTVWSIGSLDKSTMTLDLEQISGRLFYGNNTKFKEINLMSGAVVKGANKTASDGHIFKTTTFNIYEGAEIFGNHSVYSIIECNTLNMYGGRIYGNSCAYGNGLLKISTLNMFGGEIFMNFQTSRYNNYYGLFGISNGLFIYGGSIHNNVGLSNSKSGAVIATDEQWNRSLYTWGTDAIHDNYSTASAVKLKKNSDGVYVEYDEATGTWGSYDATNKKYTGILLSADNSVQFVEVAPSGNDRGFKVTVYNHSVIFKDNIGKAIEAFMILDDFSVLKSVSGASEVSVPTAYDAWVDNVAHSCANAITPIFTAQATYYGVNHILSEDVSVSYPNGYDLEGAEGHACDNCTFINKTGTLAPIFSANGYSFGDGGIAGGFGVDTDALIYYNSKNPNGAIKFGVLMFNPQYLGDSVFDENNKLTSSKGGIQIEMTTTEYSNLDFFLSGFSSNDAILQEKLQNLDIVISLYVIDGDTVDFVQKDYSDASSTPITSTVAQSQNKLYTVDFLSVKALATAVPVASYSTGKND